MISRSLRHVQNSLIQKQNNQAHPKPMPFHPVLFSSVLFFLAILTSWGCREIEPLNRGRLDQDPYRNWTLEVSVDGQYPILLDRELTLLPMGERYVLRARPVPRQAIDRTSPLLSVHEDHGSAVFLQDPENDTPLVETGLPSSISGTPSIFASAEAVFAAPTQGGHFLAGVRVRQTISESASGSEQGVAGRPDKLEQFEFEITANVLFPTRSAEHFQENGFLLGDEIGIYPDPKQSDKAFVRQNPEFFQRPDSFYRVDRDTAAMAISDHFKLGQFDLDFDYLPGHYPHYIALDPLLIQKLELLIERMNADGFGIETLHILAGFRSPKFNLGYKQDDESFSLTETFSQHMYGRAVDLIVDRNRDDRMDDLNDDGRVTIDDARVILKYVDRIDQEALDGLNALLGGAGVYYRHDIPDRPLQTPYIHVDVRGFPNAAGRPMRWVGNP